MDNTEFQYNDHQIGARTWLSPPVTDAIRSSNDAHPPIEPYWYFPDYRAFVAGPSSGQSNGFEDGRQPFQTHQSYGPMHHQYLPTFSSSLERSGSSSGNSDPLATPSPLLTPHTLPHYQGFYAGNYIDPALLSSPSQEATPPPSGEAHAFSSTSPTSDSGTCIHLPDELLTTSTPTTISPGATQLQPISSSHDELHHHHAPPPTISNYSPAAPKARKQASSTTKTNRAPVVSPSSRKGRKTGKATKSKASHPPVVKLAPLVKLTRRTHDSPVLKVTGVRGQVKSSIADDEATSTCNYTSAGGVRCLTSLQKGERTARHMGIHLRDEARSFLAHGKAFNIDVNKMALIVRDTTAYLLNHTHQGKPRFVYKPDLVMITQHPCLAPIPEDIKERLNKALTLAEGKVNYLSEVDAALFRSVATYTAQYYAHMFYTCACNNQPFAKIRVGVWMRSDEFSGGKKIGFTRHTCPTAPRKNHALRGYWRLYSPMFPYQR